MDNVSKENQQKRELLRTYLEQDAFQRMEYLKESNPEKYNILFSIIAQSVSSGNLRYKITSEQIREVIVNLEKRNDGKIEIRRK